LTRGPAASGGESVEQYCGQRLAGAEPGGYQGHAEGPFGDPEAAGCEVQALRREGLSGSPPWRWARG